LTVIGCLSSKPASVVSKAWLNDRPANEVLPPGFVDDASRLDRTHVAEGIAIAGARHSMGGHSISPERIVLNMLPLDHLQLDAEKRILRGGAGARWAEVVPYLDQQGYSVAVMQASNDFSVGGSISVNCHGWQHPLRIGGRFYTIQWPVCIWEGEAPAELHF
jgi:FAD/FMN-containing dehydrogenase